MIQFFKHILRNLIKTIFSGNILNSGILIFCLLSQDMILPTFCDLAFLPMFRHLRELFKIDAADYMLSICGNDALRELSSPGKSGSVFYLSHDDRFMIKTMRKSEVKVQFKNMILFSVSSQLIVLRCLSVPLYFPVLHRSRLTKSSLWVWWNMII